MAEGKFRFHGLNVGLTSVVVLFVVLCLTVFAVLSLSTASREKRLAEKYAASVSDYWAADALCAETANTFGALWEAGASPEALRDAAESRGGQLAWGPDGAFYISYSRRIDGGRLLAVVLKLGEKFEIKSWQTVSDGDWSPDGSLDLWTGNEEDLSG